MKEKEIREGIKNLVEKGNHTLLLIGNSNDSAIHQFIKEYNTWYSEALPLIRNLLPDRLPEFESFYRNVTPTRGELSSYSIEDYMVIASHWASFSNNRGPFNTACSVTRSKFRSQISIVESVVVRLDSILAEVNGAKFEVTVKGIIQKRIRERRLLSDEKKDELRMHLKDGRVVIFADEPDMAIYRDNKIQTAVEIKGGIDTASVLERVGAAIKSLRRTKKENPKSTTILILPGISMTQTARHDLEINRNAVNYWFTIEDILENETKREEIFRLLDI